MKDRYANIAPFYSALARSVFGNVLTDVKTAGASSLNQKRILIIGGGDGLDYSSFQSDLSGEYWELSDAMLLKAKKNLDKSKLEFHLGNFQSNPQNLFDEVWLHFVLDTFTDEKLKDFLTDLKKSLKPFSSLYVADFFAPTTSTQRVVQFFMLKFFQIFTAHERSDLPALDSTLEEQGFKKTIEISRKGGWIRGQIWNYTFN